MSKPNLKPCPFCGCEDIAISSGSVFVPDKHWYRCVCMECGAGSDSFGEKEAAIAAWNRRPETPNEPLTRDDLRNMIGEPYWYVGLTSDCPPPHWAILEETVMLHLEKFFYGETWLAYRHKVEEGNT